MNACFEPLYLVNTYGAFGSVSMVRDEIVIGGSEDVQAGRPAAPTVSRHAVPRSPRLADVVRGDVDVRRGGILVPASRRLLAGDAKALALFATKPFPQRPPRFVRALLYRYSFTRRGEPGWWKRTLIGEWMTPIARST